jgi:hypothetical protein
MVQRTRERFVTSRLPRIGAGLIVFCDDGRTLRTLAVTPEDGELHVDAYEERSAHVTGDLSSLDLDRFARRHSSAIVVAHEARLDIRSELTQPLELQSCSAGAEVSGWVLERRGAESRCVRATMPRERLSSWQERVGSLGLGLQGVYPLMGSALSGIHAPTGSRPRLVLQLEERWIASIEALGESCCAIDVRDEPPTVRGCLQLLGEGLEEVTLCGGGVDLPAFGYEFVRAGQTWPWLSRLRCDRPALAPGFAALLGAARHACGLAGVDALACVPPLRASD